MAVRITKSGVQSYDPKKTDPFSSFRPPTSQGGGSGSSKKASSEAPSVPATYRNPQGNVSGIELPNGKVYLGLNTQEVKEIAQRYQEKIENPEGAVSMEEAMRQNQREELGKSIAGEIGQTGAVGDVQKDKLDVGQALGSAAIGTIPNMIRNAATGAAVGFAAGTAVPVVGNVAGAILGGAAGALGTFAAGVVSNLKQQKGENIQAPYSNLRKSTTNLKAIITDTNQGGDVVTNVDLFNSQLAIIDEAYAKLHLEHQGKFLGKDATTELENFANFYSAGGGREMLILNMQQAVLNPNPSKTLLNIDDVQEVTTTES